MKVTVAQIRSFLSDDEKKLAAYLILLMSENKDMAKEKRSFYMNGLTGSH